MYYTDILHTWQIRGLFCRVAEGGKPCRTRQMFNLGRTGLSLFPHLWNENTILPEGCCGTNRAVCLKHQTQKRCACSTHTQPFRVRHSSQSSCLPVFKVWPWGSCLTSLCTGDLAFLDEEQATYIRAAVGPERTTERTASHRSPAHNTFHGCSASSSSLLLQAGSTPAPQEVQNLVNLPDVCPESRPFSGQEPSRTQGTMAICTTRFFSVSGGKKIFCYPLCIPFCTHCFSTEVGI